MNLHTFQNLKSLTKILCSVVSAYKLKDPILAIIVSTKNADQLIGVQFCIVA